MATKIEGKIFRLLHMPKTTNNNMEEIIREKNMDQNLFSPIYNIISLAASSLLSSFILLSFCKEKALECRNTITGAHSNTGSVYVITLILRMV